MNTQFTAGVEISLRIGQRVRLQDYKGQRVTGTVRSLILEENSALMADCVLDAPIVIPPLSEGDREITLHRQYVPAAELAPLDERDELIAELLQAAKAVAFSNGFDAALPDKMEALRAAVARATAGVKS